MVPPDSQAEGPRVAVPETSRPETLLPPSSAWVLYLTNAAYELNVSGFSNKAAIPGIVVMCMVASTACLVGFVLFGNESGVGFYSLFSYLFLTAVVVTPLTLAGIAIAAPLLRCGPIFPRFVQSMIGGCFGWSAFLLSIAMALPTDFAERIGTIVRSTAIYSISLALVVLFLQMWTPWSLQEFSRHQTPRWRLGTRDLFGVTFVFAVLCALFLGTSEHETILIQLFLVGFGIVSGGLATWLLIAFVSGARRGIPLMIVFAFLVMASMLAFAFFVTNGASPNAMVESLGVLYGFAAITALAVVASGWIASAWLRACGWRCVDDRRTP